MWVGKRALVYSENRYSSPELILGLVGLEFPNLCVLRTPEAKLNHIALTKLENIRAS